MKFFLHDIRNALRCCDSLLKEQKGLSILDKNRELSGHCDTIKTPLEYNRVGGFAGTATVSWEYVSDDIRQESGYYVTVTITEAQP